MLDRGPWAQKCMFNTNFINQELGNVHRIPHTGAGSISKIEKKGKVFLESEWYLFECENMLTSFTITNFTFSILPTDPHSGYLSDSSKRALKNRYIYTHMYFVPPISAGNYWNAASFITPSSYLHFSTFQGETSADISFYFKTSAPYGVFLENLGNTDFIKLELKCKYLLSAIFFEKQKRICVRWWGLRIFLHSTKCTSLVNVVERWRRNVKPT